MINRMSLVLAESIKKVDPDRTPSVDVLKFSLYILIHTGITVLLILAVSLVDGEPLATMLGLGYFMLLRQFSGGYHVHSSLICTILSVVLIAVAPFVPLEDMYVLILNIANAIMMLVFAPSNMKGYSRVPEKYYVVLKIVSVLIIGSNFAFNSPTLGILSLFQSILLVIPQKGGEPG